MKFKINVTQRDIDKGRPRSVCNCPVARAMRRHKGLSTAAVLFQGFHTKPNYGSPYIRFDNQVVADFIQDFDGDKPVEPFSFEIDVPEKVMSRT